MIARKLSSFRYGDARTVGQHQQPVAITDVPPRALGGVGFRRLAQMRVSRQQPRRLRQILRRAASWAPPAVSETPLDGGIERGPVHACLPTRKDRDVERHRSRQIAAN